MFLNHSLTGRHWLAFFIISCGLLSIVGQDVQRASYDQVTLPYTDHKAILTGDLLIIIAEIVHGLQYVYEEKQLKTSNVAPLQAAGWQGIFGLAITSILAICMHYLPTVSPFTESSRAVFDDWSDLLEGLKENPSLIMALIAFTVSCALYNFIGLLIAMNSSSTTRILADGLRVYFIWVFVINMDWEFLSWVTIMGFLIVQMGSILYRKPFFLGVNLNSVNEDVPNSRPADVI